MIGRAGGILALSLLAIAVATSRAGAQPPVQAEHEDVRVGRRALSDGPVFPWYDSRSDSMRRVPIREAGDAAKNRGSTWEYDPHASTYDFSWLQFLARHFFHILFWILAIAIVVALIVLLVHAFLRMEARNRQDSDDDVDELGAADRSRIENLPFAVGRPRVNLLEEARRNYESGNYAEAIVYYYSYLLVELDKHQVIRLTRGKTNRQYLWETRPRANITSILEPTMIMFEDVFFGDRPLGRERFEESWGQLDRFHEHLRKVEA